MKRKKVLQWRGREQGSHSQAAGRACAIIIKNTPSPKTFLLGERTPELRRGQRQSGDGGVTQSPAGSQCKGSTEAQENLDRASYGQEPPAMDHL